jgi:hypothetical protein
MITSSPRLTKARCSLNLAFNTETAAVFIIVSRLATYMTIIVKST